MPRPKRTRPMDPAAEVPCQRQIAAALLIFAVAALPLLPALDARIGVFIAAVIALRALVIRFPRLQPGMPVLVLLTAAGGLNVVDAYRGIAGQAPGTALLLSMVALKLLEARGKRDLRVMLLVLGFVLVVQFLFDDSMWRALLMVAVLIASFALLRDLNLPAPPPGTLPRATTGLRSAGVMAAQALPLALVLFVFFPRLDAPLWDLGLDNAYAITGLKDWLEPGSVKDLVVSGEEVMRVRFDTEPGIPVEEMYWRGPVLWHTSGNRFLPASAGAFPEAMAAVEPLSEPLVYTVLLEPSDQHWITALDAPLEAPRRARLTADLQVLADQAIAERRLFRLRSAMDYRVANISLDEELAALELPDTVTPRMQALVQDWTRDEPAPEEVVRRALAFYNEQPFRYSLLAPDMGPRPMDAFLFEERVGFCEHYAASFTLLMRMAGIPTRIVLGYLGGERNPYSNDLLIRQSDAHAWTEVWLEGKGWTRVDPTAAVAPERVDQDRRLSNMGAGAPVRFRLDDTSTVGRAIYNLHLAAQAFNVAWRRWVVGFSSMQQQDIVRGLGLERLREFGLVVLMAVGSIGIMLAWGLWLARPRAPSDPVVAAYQTFQRRLRQRDATLARRAGEGPLDHLVRLRRRSPELAAAAKDIVDAYVRLRYADTPVTDAATARLRRLVQGFRPRPGRMDRVRQ